MFIIIILSYFTNIYHNKICVKIYMYMLMLSLVEFFRPHFEQRNRLCNYQLYYCIASANLAVRIELSRNTFALIAHSLQFTFALQQKHFPSVFHNKLSSLATTKKNRKTEYIHVSILMLLHHY